MNIFYRHSKKLVEEEEKLRENKNKQMFSPRLNYYNNSGNNT